MGSRREFLRFMGYSASVSALPLSPWILQCANADRRFIKKSFQSISPSDKDDVVLAEGLKYEILIQWNDVINSKNDKFGFNNDYLAVVPLGYSAAESLLWVNHETPNPIFVSGNTNPKKKTRDLVLGD